MRARVAKTNGCAAVTERLMTRSVHSTKNRFGKFLDKFFDFTTIDRFFEFTRLYCTYIGALVKFN